MVNSEFFLNSKVQKERYELHKNTLQDSGYKRFLEKFANTTLNFYKELKDFSLLQNILDYGSGPEPALLELLEEYKSKGILDNSVELKGWDPYFNKNYIIEKNNADLVLCLEVAEHFENPLDGFRGLSDACKQNGLIAVQTMITKEHQEEFSKWWYKEDSTHVTFYSITGLEICANKAGLKYIKSINSVHFFRKN